MATIAAPHAGWHTDRLFFTGMAAALVLVTFIGFAPTYYLAPVFGARPLTPLVHVHGVVFSAWPLLLLLQTGLIAARRRDLHRTIGLGGAMLAVAIVVIGAMVAIESGRLGSGPPTRHQPSFLVFPLSNMLLFAGLTVFAVRWRWKADYHKRLMLLATMTLCITPLARISAFMDLPFRPPAIGGMILSDLFLIALIVYDRQRLGKLHPATLWAGGVYLLSQPLRVAVGQTAAWQDFARLLIG